MKSFLTTTLCTLLVLFQASAQDDTLSFAKPSKLSNNVNSTAEESLPILTEDGKTLYFARTYHPQNTGGKYAGQDIWTSEVASGNFSDASNLKILNYKANNAVVGTAKNGKRLYLLNQKVGKKKSISGLSRVDYSEALSDWGEPEPVTVPELKVEGNFYSAFVGSGEDYILWTLPGDGLDTTNNIYVSLSEDKGETWSAPMYLGATINSMRDDISPFYDEARKLLFWSTNGREGRGGYDIYYARRLGDAWTEWSEPVNAGSEINSPGFDAYFFASADGTAYFSSNRNDSLANIYLSSMVITPADDKDEKDIDEVDSDEVAEDVDDKSNLRDKDPVLIIDTKDGSSDDRSLTSLSLEELLDKDTHIRFVYFPYDKYNITAKYIEVLDNVGDILDTYQQLGVRIEGHTDHIGSQAYNMVLSQNRALSTKEYLLIHGIDEGRIETRAHGKLQPYATNETEEGRALNRRVELYFFKK